MPQTFSPHTSETPEMAAPTAKCSQFLRAISVEPERAGEDRHLHLHLVRVTELGLGVDHREERVVGVALDAVGQALRAQRVALDVEVRVVDRVVLVAAGGHLAERTGVDDLAAAERGLEDLAVAAAAVDAASAQPGARDDVLRAVRRLRGVAPLGTLQIHAPFPSPVVALPRRNCGYGHLCGILSRYCNHVRNMLETRSKHLRSVSPHAEPASSRGRGQRSSTRTSSSSTCGSPTSSGS